MAQNLPDKLPYSLIIETTDEDDFFGFYSPDLEGFTGTGRSIEDCIARARAGMNDHLSIMISLGQPTPSPNPNATTLLHRGNTQPQF